MLNTTGIQGSWNDQKAKLKQKFAVLLGNDHLFDEDKKDELLGNLQLKLGKSKEEIQEIISAL